MATIFFHLIVNFFQIKIVCGEHLEKSFNTGLECFNSFWLFFFFKFDTVLFFLYSF